MEYKKLFEELLETLISEDGSDLHLSAGRFPAVRVNGELIFLMTRPELTQADLEGILKAILSPENYTHFTQSKDLDFSFAGLSNILYSFS
jgi:twitching motility protein PilT